MFLSVHFTQLLLWSVVPHKEYYVLNRLLPEIRNRGFDDACLRVHFLVRFGKCLPTITIPVEVFHRLTAISFYPLGPHQVYTIHYITCFFKLQRQVSTYNPSSMMMMPFAQKSASTLPTSSQPTIHLNSDNSMNRQSLNPSSTQQVQGEPHRLPSMTVYKVLTMRALGRSSQKL